MDKDAIKALLAQKIADIESHEDSSGEEEDIVSSPCFKRALSVLNVRARSTNELRGRLKEAGFELHDIDVTIKALTEYGYLDDISFSKEWVRQRHELRGKSRFALDQELRIKGVSSSIRKQALKQISEQDEWDCARKIADKKVRTLPHKPESREEYNRFLRRVASMLARRGFSASICRKVARTALNEYFS